MRLLLLPHRQFSLYGAVKPYENSIYAFCVHGQDEIRGAFYDLPKSTALLKVPAERVPKRFLFPYISGNRLMVELSQVDSH